MFGKSKKWNKHRGQITPCMPSIDFNMYDFPIEKFHSKLFTSFEHRKVF